MVMEKAFVAQRVYSKLQTTETAIETAMSEAANLISVLIEARRDLNVSTVVGDKELESLTQAIAALDTARKSTVQLHHGLAQVARQLHVPVKMFGPAKGAIEQEDRPMLRAAS